MYSGVSYEVLSNQGVLKKKLTQQIVSEVLSKVGGRKQMLNWHRISTKSRSLTVSSLCSSPYELLFLSGFFGDGFRGSSGYHGELLHFGHAYCQESANLHTVLQPP